MSVIFTSDNWKEQVLEAQKPVVVDFWAHWCSPCRMIAPTVDKLAKQREDIIIGKLNIDDDSDVASYNRVSSIPTLIFFQNGKEIHRVVGTIGEQQLDKLLNEKFTK